MQEGQKIEKKSLKLVVGKMANFETIFYLPKSVK